MTKKRAKQLSIIIMVMLMLICIMVAVMGCTEEVNGKFYTLQEAYDEGWLTQEDLLNIAYYHNGGIKGNEEIFPQNYTPRQKDNLDDNIAKAIKQVYLNQFYSYKENTSIDDVTIQQYYGTYNGCVALMMSDEYSGTCAAIFNITVANVQFVINGRGVYVWKETI